MPAAELAPDERSREIEQADQPNSPAAKLKRRGWPAKNRHADRLVGDVGGQMQLDERYVKPQTKKPTVSSQNASVANASCSPALEPSGMIMPRLAAARGSRSPGASGAIAVDTTPRIDILMCQLSSRCCSSDANGTIANCPIEPPAVVTPSATERFSVGVCRLTAPRIGPNPAAAMPMPLITLPSVKARPAVANAVMNMPAT